MQTETANHADGIQTTDISQIHSQSIPTTQTDSGIQPSDCNQPAFQSSICSRIVENQQNRKATMRMIFSLENSALSLCRRALGFKITLPEDERSKIRKDAVDLKNAIEEGKTPDSEVAKAVGPFITSTIEARNPYDIYRKKIEKEMIADAKLLPAYPWVKDIKGAGALGLAIIIGESGDLSNYSSHYKLWKRLGLFPPEAYRMPTKSGGTALLIPKERRAAVWTVADSLLKKENHYREIYKNRRDYEMKKHPEFIGKMKANGENQMKMHGQRRSARYAEKMFIRDLWCNWNGKEIPKFV